MVLVVVMRLEVQEEMGVIREVTTLGEFDDHNLHSTCESSTVQYWRSGFVHHDGKSLKWILDKHRVGTPGG